MKKVLFIIQSYPSERSANVLCDEKIMKSLINTGHYEVHCLCYQYDNQPLEEVIDGIHVHRWNRGGLWRLYSKAEFRGMRGRNIVIKLNRIFMRIKQVLFVPLFPFYEPVLAFRFKLKARKLYDKILFDIVLAEHNGLDTVYAGWKLKQKKNTVFIPVFWDSLSGGFRPKYLPKGFVDRRKEKLEEKIVNDSDCAIMMQSHEAHGYDLYSKKPNILNKITFLDIPYLDMANKSRSQINREKINIVFAGNMSMRDPSYFFKVVEISDTPNIVIHFFTDQKDGTRIRRLADSYNITVETHNYLPHNELVKYLKDADVLLNFGVDNPNAISGKIFEYIGFVKPIISTYFIDDEAVLPVLNKYPAALLLDERKEPKEYESAIGKFLADYEKAQIDVGLIERTFKNNLPETYVETIEKVLNERSR